MYSTGFLSNFVIKMNNYNMLEPETNGLNPDGYVPKEHIISYEEAVKLKESGFNLRCKYFYGDGELHSNQWIGNYNNEAIANTCGTFEEVISAPTFSEVLQWKDIEYCKTNNIMRPEFDFNFVMKLQERNNS